MSEKMRQNLTTALHLHRSFLELIGKPNATEALDIIWHEFWSAMQRAGYTPEQIKHISMLSQAQLFKQAGYNFHKLFSNRLARFSI